MQEKDQFILNGWGISQKWKELFLYSLKTIVSKEGIITKKETPFEKSGFQQYVFNEVMKSFTQEQILEKIETTYQKLADKITSNAGLTQNELDNAIVLKAIYKYGVKVAKLNITKDFDKFNELDNLLLQTAYNNKQGPKESYSDVLRGYASPKKEDKFPLLEEITEEEEDNKASAVKAAQEIGRSLSRKEIEEKESPKTQANETTSEVEVKILSKIQEMKIENFLSTSSGSRPSGLVVRGRAAQLARKNNSEGKLPIPNIAAEVEGKKSEEKTQERSTTPEPVPFSETFRTIKTVPLPKPKQPVAPKADSGSTKPYPLMRRGGYIEVLKREARTPSPPDRTNSPANIKSSRPL